MRKGLRFAIGFVLVVFATMISAYGQETTGSLEITVKDAADAVVPSVPITVSSSGASTGFKRTISSDSSGFVRLVQVPPGTYTITSAATSGFVEKKIEQISIGLGRVTQVVMVLTTTIGETVTVTGDQVLPIDVTDTKIQTTVTSELAELLPKGLNFSTVLKFSPATRPEPRSGQFQIDGASGSENTFVIDGQEVTNVLSGTLDANSNLPFSIVQEVQVKSSGFEAEYGGATGGVINLVTKGGSNQLRGEFGLNLRSSRAEPIPGYVLRSNSGVPEYYPPRRNQYQFNETNPTAVLGGPIWKDKAWFFGSYAPQIYHEYRKMTYLNASRQPTGRIEKYLFTQRKEALFMRLDGQPISRVRVTGTFNWNPITQTGARPGFSSELGAVPAQAGNPDLNGAAFLNQTGGRQNSMNYTIGGAYSVTNNLLVTARFGHYFLNTKLGTYGYGNVLIPAITCAAAPFSNPDFPAGFGCSRVAPNNTNKVTPFGNTVFDATTRDQYDADATYNFSLGGRHEMKGGYQSSGIGNKVREQNTDSITLRWGTGPFSTVAAYSGVPGLTSSPGATGSGVISIIETSGNVSSKNTAFYVQDKWQPFNRLTLNLGVRTEKEDVPSYARGLPGMNFRYSQKIAPRLGGAYDLTGDGKTKVSAFYGLFYDRFKLTLPRGSFGGDVYHSLYFELFAGDTLASINRNLIFGNGGPVPGGSCQPVATPIFGRVRCDKDFRVPSNIGGDLLAVGGIDPNIRPFQQREITFTFQRQLSKLYTLSARYTKKSVLHAVEDGGFPNAEGSEVYIIGNPGEGLYKKIADSFGLLAPRPQREYDALELRFDRGLKNSFFFSANYTFSRLYGNYGGLASSDEEGRSDPNVNRYFDQPHAGFTAAGGPDNGRLATDRPHVFKAYGAYRLNWKQFGLSKNHTSDFELFTTAQTGTLITSFVNINDVSQIILTKRGDQGRTPIFSQTDVAVNHSINFGREGRFTIKFDADIINVFNQYTVTNKGLNPSGQGGNIINTQNFNVTNIAYGLVTQAQLDACNSARNQTPCLVAAYKIFQKSGSQKILDLAKGTAGHNLFYNLPSAFQGKRTIRYGVRLIF